MAGADPKSWVDVLRHDVIPVASAFLVFVLLVLAYRRRRSVEPFPLPGPGAGRRVGWGPLVRHVTSTALGGYALFLLIVVVFYLVLGGEAPRFVTQAVGEGSLLAFGIVVPAFLALSWAEERLRGRRRPRTRLRR